jgi:hypothetical protein
MYALHARILPWRGTLNYFHPLYSLCAAKFNRNTANPWGESTCDWSGNEKHCEIDAHVSNNVSHAVADAPSVLAKSWREERERKCEKNYLSLFFVSLFLHSLFSFISLSFVHSSASISILPSVSLFSHFYLLVSLSLYFLPSLPFFQDTQQT